MGISIDQINDENLRRKIRQADAEQNRGRGLVGLRSEKSESDQRSKSQDRELEEGPPSVAIRITFCAFTKRVYDSDNCVAAQKAVRDAVCETLGITDADSEHLSFEYHQVLSKTPGVLVKIECEQP